MKKLYLLLLAAAFFCLSSCSSLSENKKENFTKVDVTMNEYLSSYKPLHGKNLPVIKINSISGSNAFATEPVDEEVSAAKKTWNGYKGEPAPYNEDCFITVVDDKNEVSLESVSAKVKVRGNWTSNYPKKGLRIKFSEKQTMLGLNDNSKFKTWVLLSSYKDWSFLRDSTGLYLSKLISSDYASDFCLVDVYINDSYWGVYLLAESQEVNKKRINITKNPEGYEGFDIGYLLELDSHFHHDENNFKIKYTRPVKDFENTTIKTLESTYTINSDINSKAQIDFIKNYLEKVFNLCYEASYNNVFYEFNESFTELVPSSADNCYECVSKVIDIDSLINTYILQEIVCDPDLYLTSFYMDVDFGEKGNKKLTFEAPWDFDSSLGNKRFCTDSQGLFAAVNAWDVDHRTKGVGNAWMLVFVRCDWFQTLVRQKWASIHDQKIIDSLVEHIDFVTKNYEKNFINNYKVWRNAGNNEILGNELCNNSAVCRSQKEASDYLRSWLIKRFAFLDELWLE